MNRAPYTDILSAALMVLLPSALIAADLDHQPIPKSAALSYETVFASALENAPERLAESAIGEQVHAYQAQADRVFTGSPQLRTNYIDDRALDSDGLREIEAGIQFSLWRPGEREGARNLGRDYDRLQQAWIKHLELITAGRVRTSLANLQTAETLLQVERQFLATASELVGLTEALEEAGEVSGLDVMQAVSEQLAQQQRVFDAEASLVDAEREYQVLTGLNVRPDTYYTEQRSALNEVPEDHVLLAFIKSEIDVANSRVAQVRRLARGSPAISLGVRRERGTRLVDYTDSIGIGFSMPVGKSASVESQVSDARRQRADLDVGLRQALLALQARFHEAEHELFVTAQKLQSSEQAAQLSEERWQLYLDAYELGEAGLLETVFAFRELLSAQQELTALRLQREALLLEYNQSLGVLP